MTRHRCFGGLTNVAMATVVYVFLAAVSAVSASPLDSAFDSQSVC